MKYRICTYKHEKGGWGWEVYDDLGTLLKRAEYNYAETHQPTWFRWSAKEAARSWAKRHANHLRRVTSPELECEDVEV